MSEQQLLGFRDRAVQLVELPDLADLESRGAALRRRRQGWTAVVAAAVLAAVAWASVSVSQPRADQTPAEHDDTLAGAESYYGFDSRPLLDPGSYYWRVSPYLDHATAVVTLPRGWHAWRLGPNRWFRMDGPHDKVGYAGLLATEVYDVVHRACQPGTDGMRRVGPTSADLVDALVDMPRQQLVDGPRTVEKFGQTATFLRLRAGDVRCPLTEGFLMMSDTGIGQVIPTAGSGTFMDLWVVDVRPRPVLVAATWDPRSPSWLTTQLHDVADTLRLVEP